MALPDPIRWTAPEAIASLLTTELNALAVDTASSASATQDQDAAQYPYVDLELAVTFAAAPVEGEFVEVLCLIEMDGTNFATTDKGNAGAILTIIPVLASGSAQRLIVRGVLLPPNDFKIAVVNRTSQAFTASGHTLKMQRYSPTIID